MSTPFHLFSDAVCLFKAATRKDFGWSFIILKISSFFLERLWKHLCSESSQCLHFTPWNLSGLFNFVPWLCKRTFDQSPVHTVLMYFCGSFLLGTNYFFFLEMRWFVMGLRFAETPVNPPTSCTRNISMHADTREHTHTHTLKCVHFQKMQSGS